MKQIPSLAFALPLLIGASFLAAQPEPEFTQPGWFTVPVRPGRGAVVLTNTGSGKSLPVAEAVSIRKATDAGGTILGVPSGTTPIAEAITPEIQELARGLENDPVKIFEFVRDRIRYVHYFGSKKGATLTLLERSGNDFDQCALLVALLRAAGYTNVGYRFGTVLGWYQINSGPGYHRDIKHWCCLTKPNTNWLETGDFVSSFYILRGFPFIGWFEDVPNVFVFHHLWVWLNISNVVYELDPAFKVYEPSSGINLAQAMGLDTNQLMTLAGGTATADYVQSLNETALRDGLRNCTTNLLGYLRSNYPNSSVDRILGSWSVAEGQYFGKPLPFMPFEWETNCPVLEWTFIPTNMMTSLRITVDGTTNRFLHMPALAGRKLGLTFNSNGLAQLWLEDELLLQKQTSGGRTVNVVLHVDHPHGLWDWTSNRLINTNWDDHVTTNTYQRTNATYVIAYAFMPHRDWLEARQRRLDQFRAIGFANDSRQVLTETLQVMALSWLVQTALIEDLMGVGQQVLPAYHHRLGRMAFEQGNGYYIDVYQQLSAVFAATGLAPADLARTDKAFDLSAYFASAAEHGLIEQLQSSNLTASSTIKMLQVANSLGQRIYLARSANWSSIQGSLTGYDKNYLKTNFIDMGYQLLMPACGTNRLAGPGSWTGYGIVAKGSLGDWTDMQMLIKGGYFGGYAAWPYVAPDPLYVYDWNYTAQPVYFDYTPVMLPELYSVDPVNIASGTFEINSTDLSVGGLEPRGIAFARHYSSARRFHNPAALGNGWTHNWDCRAAEVSAPWPRLGLSTPQQMAPMMVAICAATELYSTTPNPKNWAVTALIAKWALDQTISNAVSISLGKDTLQFVKQPDGSFTPPAGSTHTLLKTNGVYWLQERHGRTFKFNHLGLLTNITDPYNQQLTVSYDASNRVQTIRDWKNRTLTFTYTGERLTSIQDSTGRTVRYLHSTNAGKVYLGGVVDPEGKTNRFICDTNWQIIATIDPLGRTVVSNVYNSSGRVVTQFTHGDTNKAWHIYWSGYENVEKDPSGARTRYRFDEKFRLLDRIDPLGNWYFYAYDGQDHLIWTATPLWEQTDYFYDGRHNLIAVLDPLGHWIEHEYDAQDRRIRTIDQRNHTNHFAYNAQHSLIATTNAAGDWVRFEYNTDGTLRYRIDPAGTNSYFYDSWGQLARIVYPAGLGTNHYLNNARGDVLAITNARGFVTQFQYNSRRQLTNTIAPTNVVTRRIYDAAGNLQATIDPRGFVTSNLWSPTAKLLATYLPHTPAGTPVISNIYDARDWLLCTINPVQYNYRTWFTNDPAGRLIATTDPLGRPTRFAYDDDGRLIRTTNAANEVTRQFWNARGELIRTADGAGRTVNYRHDEAGNRTWLTNRNGKPWQFQYDAANRLTNTISPLNRQTWQIWNNRGLLHAVREPSGQWTTNLYDAKGRLTNRLDGIGSTLYRYDPNDNLTNLVLMPTSGSPMTNSWTYDAYDRVSSYRDPDGNLIQYRYDPAGNLTNLVYPGGRNVYYSYDSHNRLTNVTDWANRQTSFEYDLAGRLRKIIRPNGTVRQLDYDPAGQLTNILELMPNGQPIVWIRQGWNAAGRIEWEFTAPLPHPYTPPQRVMTYDDDNRLLTVNGQSVSHDLDGNMTWGPLTNGQFTSLVYDARNRLIAVGGTGSTPAVGYAYDPAGNRIAMTNASVVTRFVVDPNTTLSRVLIRIRPGVTNYYIYGLGLLYEVTETATNSYQRYYHYDYRGSTVALTDHAGTVTDRTEYSAYGTITWRTGTTDTPFLFNGRYGVQTDPHGLLYMRARYYNPFICRFINPDPIGFSGGLNWYAYADGNPVSYLDPFGLCAAESGGFWSWLGSAGGGFVEAGWDTICGLWSAVTHPVQTASGLWNAVTHPGQTLDALSIALAEYADRVLGGDPRAFGAGAFELVSMALPATKVRYLDKAGDIGRVASTAPRIANPIPATLARVIPEGIPATTLGKPGAVDVFVTAAEDIAGMNAAQISKVLGIPLSPTGYRVIEFPTPPSGIASPVFRTDPGFVGGGRTIGGAREFVIPNQPIPENAVIRVVR